MIPLLLAQAGNPLFSGFAVLLFALFVVVVILFVATRLVPSPPLPDIRVGDTVRALTAAFIGLPPEVKTDDYYTEGVVERMSSTGDLYVRESSGALTRCFRPSAVILRRAPRVSFAPGDRVTSLRELPGPFDEVTGTVTALDGDDLWVRTGSGQTIRVRVRDTRHVAGEEL